MRYIQDIFYKGKRVDKMIGYKWDVLEDYTVAVRDGDKVESGLSIKRIEPPACIGVSLSAPYLGGALSMHGLPTEYTCRLLVCNTPKTVQIHRHVGVVCDQRELDFSHSDVMVLDGSRKAVIGDKSLITGTLRDVVRASGPMNSAFTKQSWVSGDIEAYNLYDFFVMMCKATGLNLTAYETIHLYNSRTADVVTLELSHDHEAERFYTKMLLDVSRK